MFFFVLGSLVTPLWYQDYERKTEALRDFKTLSFTLTQIYSNCGSILRPGRKTLNDIKQQIKCNFFLFFSPSTQVNHGWSKVDCKFTCPVPRFPFSPRTVRMTNLSLVTRQYTERKKRLLTSLLHYSLIKHTWPPPSNIPTHIKRTCHSISHTRAHRFNSDCWDTADGRKVSRDR